MNRRRVKKTAAVPPTELPTAYGQTRLTLLDVDPFTVHAAWEITPRDRAAAEKKFGAPATAYIWVLRFHDERDGSAFDIPINPDAHSWYVQLLAADKTYHAELGPYAVPGEFVAVCRSNTITTPPAAPAPPQEPRWLAVTAGLDGAAPEREEEQKAEVRGQKSDSSQQTSASSGVLQDFPLAGSPLSVVGGAQLEPALAEALAAPYADFPLAEAPHAEVSTPVTPAEALALPAAVATLLAEKPAVATDTAAAPADTATALVAPAAVSAYPASSETVSSFSLGGGAAPAAITLELNAEVIVYGRAQPGQTLCVNGRAVPVNADGTFHVRWALPVAKP